MIKKTIYLDNKIIQTINKIINKQSSYLDPKIDNIRLYYNSKGISSSTSDDIYISCNPVGHSGTESYNPTTDHPNINLPNIKQLIPFKLDMSTEALILVL